MPPPPDLPDPAWERSLSRFDRMMRLVWVGVVVVVVLVGFALTVKTGREDSALLFVGLPAFLALLLVLAPRPDSLHGTVFVTVTIVLLLCAALLQEGAVCLLFAAPLVYAVGHGVAAVVDVSRRRIGAVLVLPLIVATSVEGVLPTLRIAPVQTVTITRQVALAPDAIGERVAAGPRFGKPRPLLLRVGYPVPAHATGPGIAVGQRWHFRQHGGAIVTEVLADRTVDGERMLDFGRVQDTSMTAHSVVWRGARLSWRETGPGRSTVRLAITFERELDPSWYFGALEDAFVRAGAHYLLDGLGLEPAR